MQKLEIAENNRFLVKEDGSPFVWIGETNWFFSKLPPSTIDSILDKRSSQGFTIMFVSCREKLYNGDDPGEINSPNESWWVYLDEYIEKCQKKNLYVGVTLGWWGIAMNNSETDLFNYGKWVGNRYKHNNNIVWLTLGEAGSFDRKNTIPDSKLNALIAGIRKGDTENKLLTVHADYQRGTSLSNDGELCDFNNWQTSQWCCSNELPRKDNQGWTVWDAIGFDYQKLYNGNPKPTIDSEAWYENNKDFCGATAFHIRRRAYFTIFAGALGHTYGAGGIWDGLKTNEGCSSSAIEALNHPGAEDMGHLSSLLHALGEDLLKLRPDQGIIKGEISDNYDSHIQAALANDHSFALIYSASDAPNIVRLDRLSGRSVSALWYNPRNNEILPYACSPIKRNKRSHIFDPPGDLGAGNDWVLIIGNNLFIKHFRMY